MFVLSYHISFLIAIPFSNICSDPSAAAASAFRITVFTMSSSLEKLAALIGAMDLEVATPAQARQIMHILPGKRQ